MNHHMPLSFTLQLALQQEDDIAEDVEGYTFHSQTTGRLNAQARFPKPGIYCLTVFAKAGTEAVLYESAFRYVILVPVQMESCKPFPKQYNGWSLGCAIEGFDEGDLEENTKVAVNVTVPNAAAVAVVGKDWTYLKQVFH